jgi:hypothetical protein
MFKTQEKKVNPIEKQAKKKKKKRKKEKKSQKANVSWGHVYNPSTLEVRGL